MNVKPTIEELHPLQDRIRESLENKGISYRQVMKIAIVVDEIFSNIVNYSQATEVDVSCDVDEKQILLTFSDNGIPFNPLEKEPPELSSTAVERKIGGLGIFITCKTMDHVEYCYENGKNVLIITSLIVQGERKNDSRN